MSRKGQSDQLIRLASVSRHYPTADGSFYALQRVTLELPAGEFIGVVGRSGSGKSTLVNLIAGLDRPSEGQIWVAGNEVSAMSEDELSLFRGRHVGVVFQFFQLLP